MTAARRTVRRGGLWFSLALGFGLATLPASAQQSASRHPFYDGLGVADLTLALSSLQQSLETRRSRDAGMWRNAATGNSGSVMPLRTFRIKTGHYCREYKEILAAGGRIVSRQGTACRDGQGKWITVER